MRRRRSVGRGIGYDRVLIVGGGRAGVAAAEELRRQGFGGGVVVMCDEPEAPYDRPSCSKGILTGHKRPRDVRMPVPGGLNVEWAMGRRAVHLDPLERAVYTDTEEVFGYDGLVIATGAHPTQPPDWPIGQPGFHTLHGLTDAWALRRDLRYARKVAVIGAGLTGCEAASGVRSMAMECVLIDSKPHVMARPLGEVVSQYVTDEVAREGVQLRLGRRVSHVSRSRRGWVLHLDDGSEVISDVVIATLGERPDTEWLAQSGLDVTDGVLCDETLRVVGGEDVVAAGTVARWPNLQYSGEARRCGQWIAAMEQGRAAATALLAGDRPVPPATVVPRFWSEQFGLRIQVCGELPADAEVDITRVRLGRRDVARGGVLVGYHQSGRPVGLVAVNATRMFTTAARMMLSMPVILAEPAPAVQEPPVRRRHLAAVA